MPFWDFLKTKAGSVNNSQQQIFNIITGEQCNNNLTSEQLVKLNKGWVAVCNNKIANTCASIPLKLYYKNSSGKNITRTAHKALNKKELQRISKALKINKSVDIVEIDEHPFIDLMDNINDGMNYGDFCKNVFSYMGLIGNSYVRVEKDGGMLPIALYPLVSEYVSVFADNAIDGKITRYEYRIDNMVYSYSPDEIIHFKNLQPSNNILGRGELEGCLSAVSRYNYYDAFESYVNRNNGRPDFAISYKQNINEKDLKELYKQFMRAFGGKGAQRPIITTGEFDIRNLGFPPKEMQWATGRTWAREEIAAQFNIPLPLLTTQDVNLANALSAQNTFLRYCIFPKLSEFCNKINEVLMPMYEDNLYVWFEESVLEDPVIKNAGAISAFQAGVIDKNEARSVLGFEPVEEMEPIDAVEPIVATDNTDNESGNSNKEDI